MTRDSFLAVISSGPKSGISDDLYDRFYNEEHLPSAVKSGLIHVGYRYQNADPKAPKPQYIALYPVPDISIFTSDKAIKFAQENKSSQILGCEDISESVEFNPKFYEKISTFDPKAKSESEGRAEEWYGEDDYFSGDGDG